MISDVPSEMVVTWVTVNFTNGSTVLYGREKLDNRVDGDVTKFVDGGDLHRTMYIHRVKLTGLIPGKKYGMLVCDEEYNC